MTSQQYEELCRFFIAEQFQIEITQVVSRNIANPRRERESGYDPLPSRPHIDLFWPYQHQLDLYWKTGVSLAQYVNIANAKWRGRMRVQQHEMMLLQKVREQVGAHKAFMITNSDFTGGALRVAVDAGIGLLIVRPNFNSRSLPATRRSLILGRIQELAQRITPLYTHEVVCKAFEPVVPLCPGPAPVAESAARGSAAPSCDQRMLPGSPTGVPLNQLATVWQGGSRPVSAGGPGDSPGGYATRQGPGPGFHTK